MNLSRQFSFGAQWLPKLKRCPNCGGPAHAYLDGDNIGLAPEQPYVYICCDHCGEKISSGELLGDLTEIPVLDKLSRIITLWNREVYRPRPQLPAKPVDPATVRLRRQPPL
ncbi:MAG: hypothetical protein KDJ38_02100 [Gammaproteobacteria bacterium]|nr:hypothetical protein [Gammaproteobacteria bacterium]